MEFALVNHPIHRSLSVNQYLSSLDFPVELRCEKCGKLFTAGRDEVDLFEMANRSLGKVTTNLRAMCPEEGCGHTVSAERVDFVPVQPNVLIGMRETCKEAREKGRGAFESINLAICKAPLYRNGVNS